MRCRLPFALAVFSLTLLVPMAAWATLRPAVKVQLAGEFVPAQASQPWRGTLQILSGGSAPVDDIRIEGTGWRVSLKAAQGAWLEPGDILPVEVEAWPSDPDEPLELSFLYDGEVVTKTLHLGLKEYESATLPVPTRTSADDGSPFPAVDPQLQDVVAHSPHDLAPKDRHPRLQTVHDETHDLGSEGMSVAKSNITVSGRFVYDRDDGNTYGADHITVRVYDEDSSFDTLLASGTTDTYGNFSFTFDWDPCFLCDKRPDIYVEVETQNSWVEVERAGLLEKNYVFATGTTNDYEGTNLALGWFGPGDEQYDPAIHILNHITRTWRWINDNTGRNTPAVDVQWPEPSTNAAYYVAFFEEIHISDNRQWREDTIAHEFGHHFMENFAVNTSAQYCNGICDESATDCSHCIWCEENATDAFNEGWPNWLADIVTRDHINEYGYAVRNFRSQENIRDCEDSDGNACPCDPRFTEGFLGAVLRDIEDSTDDDHPEFPGVEDKMSWGFNEIFTVIDLDQPTTPLGFLYDFKARYPSSAEDLWETAANCGYDIDQANPNIAFNFSSSSHTLGVDSPARYITMNWDTAVDDCSGTVGYSISYTAFPDLPDATQDIGKITSYRSQLLAPGTYYVNLRAVDKSGRWSSNYAFNGPYILREATPADLAFELRPGWSDVVVPRSVNNSTSSSVPAPVTLTGNTKSTYWNFRVKNVGETLAPAFTTWVFADDNFFFDPFDPVEYSFDSNGLNVNVGQYAMNLGPIELTGGRHTFGAKLDFSQGISENDETNNEWARQWVWSPLPLTIVDAAELRTESPPDRNGGWDYATGPLWYNSDGIRFDSSGWWNALYMTTGEFDVDFDLRLHPASTGPGNGFATHQGYSTRGPAQLDAVFVNRNVTGSVQPWDVGVTQGSNDRQFSNFRVRHVVSSLLAFGVPEQVSLDTSEYLILREFYVSGVYTGPVSLVVEADTAQWPFAIQWLDQTFETGDMLDYAAWTASDASGRARLDLNIPTTGYNCLVIYRDMQDNAPLNLTIEVDATEPEILPNTPTSWYASVIPHPFTTDLVNIPAPATLPGNQVATYFSLSIQNDSPTGITVPLIANTSVDGVVRAGTNFPSFPGNSTNEVHTAATSIRGGRHTLTLECDPDDNLDEIDEDNNFSGEQWIWTPLDLALTTPVSRLQPRDRTAGWTEVTAGALWYNCDGLRTPVFAPSGDVNHFGAVAVMSKAGSNVDVRLHETSAGAQDGFAENLGTSAWGPDQSDFVIANFYETSYRAFDAGVLDFTGASGYAAEAVVSSFVADFTGSGGTSGPHALGADRIVNLHEVQFGAGVNILKLVNHDGAVDYGLTIHPLGEQFMTKADAIDGGAAWFAPAGADEILTVDVPASDRYCVSVWKVGSEDLPLTGSYSLEAHGTITSNPPGAEIVATRLASVHPNPFNPSTSVAFELAVSTEVRLDVYNIRGELVRRLARTPYPAGRHEIVWNGTDDRGQSVASGTYIVQLEADGTRQRRKAILLK